MRKSISILLAILMLLGMFPMAVSAAEISSPDEAEVQTGAEPELADTGADVDDAETGKAITEIKIKVNHPIIGQKASFRAEFGAYGYSDPDYDVDPTNTHMANMKNGVCWYDQTNSQVVMKNDSSFRFAANNKYQVYVAIKANNGNTFSTSLNIKINGQTGSVYQRYRGVDEVNYVIVTLSNLVPYTPYYISEINVPSITSPVEHSIPRYWIDAYNALDSRYDISMVIAGTNRRFGVTWRNATDYYYLDPDGTGNYIYGKDYEVTVLLRAKSEDGYVFSGSPTVKINGNSATFDGFDGDNYLITVKYTFACRRLISKIELNVEEPYPGGSPSYSASVPSSVGSSYRVFTRYKENTDGWNNGIRWIDDNGRPVTGEFQDGQYYTVQAAVTTGGGYGFNNTLMSSFNGKDGNVGYFGEYEDFSLLRLAHKRFLCAKNQLSMFDLYITPPKAGDNPTYSAQINTADPGYKIEDYNAVNWRNGIVWHNVTDGGSALSPSDTFVQGKTYSVRFSLVPIDTRYYEFQNSGLSARVNNADATVGIYSEKKNIWVERQFTVQNTTTISSVSVSITAPVKGNSPAFVAGVPISGGYKVSTDLTDSATGYIRGIRWIDSNDKRLTREDTFEAGKRYTVWIWLLPKDNYTFAQSGLTATVSGNNATVAVNNGGANICVTYSFWIPREINDLALFLDKPVPDMKPAYDPFISGYTTADYQIRKTTDNLYKDGVLWTDVTDGSSVYVSPNSTFTAGRKYKVTILLEAKDPSKAQFALTNQRATLNDRSANFNTTSGYEGERASVTYTFTCPTTINRVDLTYTPPVAGQHPSFVVTVPSGAKYMIDTESEKDYSINGVRWSFFNSDHDVEYLDQYDTFKPGVTYYCGVDLVPVSESYVFRQSSSPYVSFNAEEGYVSGASPEHMAVWINATCPEVDVIDEVSVSITEPVPGQHPVFSAAVPSDVNYRVMTEVDDGSINGVEWRRIGDGGSSYTMSQSDVFEEGVEYACYVVLKIKSGDAIFADTDEGTAYVNGDYAEFHNYGNAYSVQTMWTKSTHYCTSQTYKGKVSGKLVSFIEDGKIDLILENNEYAMALFTSANGQSTIYQFTDVPTGSYTLVVSKDDHVTRRYQVEITEGTTKLDIKIHPLGDIDGDGQTTTFDFALANAHAKGVSTLTGYQYDCADVDEDGSVTTFDAALINSHAKGVNPLW